MKCVAFTKKNITAGILAGASMHSVVPAASYVDMSTSNIKQATPNADFLAQAVIKCNITLDTAQEIESDTGNKVPSKNSKGLMITMTEEDLQGNGVISANIDLQVNEANDVEPKKKDGKEVEDTDCDTSNNKQQFVGMKEVASENGNVLKTRNLLDRKNTKEGVNNVDDKQQNLKCEAESNFVENQCGNEVSE